jgi:hypothetical protein
MFVLGEEEISNFTGSWDFVIFKVRSPTVSNGHLWTFKKKLRCAEMLIQEKMRVGQVLA